MIILVITLILPPVSLNSVRAYSDHPNLFVSAENSLFNNHFAGPMVVEVIVREDNTQLDQAIGEPNVSLNGRHLRMAQGSDGNWYAFFANTDKAKQADQVALSGSPGQSIDFGVFCSGTTPSSVLGADFSQADGAAIPDSAGLSGTTQGNAGFNSCSGNATSPLSQNNVIRNPPSLNTNPKVPVGQIGINLNVWPLIQLFSFTNNVHIEYDRSTGAQSVDLDYTDIPNITLSLDRTAYPSGSEVFATINDIELDIDPTSQDSWTFNIASPEATFYQAFAVSGNSASGPGLVNLLPSLNSLGFKDNGHLTMNIGSVINLKTNSIQSSTLVTSNGVTYNKLVTFVETGTNTGIFQSSFNSISTIGILSNAPRFQSGTIEYNLQSASIVSGTSTASLSLGSGQGQFNPGQKQVITLADSDQNLNPSVVDELDVFRSSAVIPTLKIGNPVTLGSSSDVNFYANSAGFSSPISVPSNIPDANSARLIIDTRVQPSTNFEKITINLGITVQSLKSLFIDTTQANSGGTNWINYDLRSFQKQLGIQSFSDTSMTLYFGGLPGTSSVQIMAPGTITSGNGLVQISDATIASIESAPSTLPVFLEINFDNSSDPSKAGKISNEIDKQPIVFDLFSFGSQNGQQVNNAVYRAELQETSSNSGVFSGTIEYAVINQLNQFDPSLIKSLRTFGSNIKFLVNNQLTDEKGINFSILSSQAGQPSIVTAKNNLPTHTGVVTLDSSSYRLGQTVTVTVYDPDLVTDANTVVTYTTVNDPNSPAVDTVGDSSGNILLEVWIKGFRYHQCTINGITTGGLAASGFTLTETGPGSGIFKGTFRIPSKICNEDGTALISPTGGSVQAWYHDFRDAFGRSVVISSSTTTNPTQQTPPTTVINQYSSSISKSTEISDESGRPLLQNPHIEHAMHFKSTISNSDYKNSQQISYIVQIKDSDMKVIFLKWINGNVGPSSATNQDIQWIPDSSGVYFVEIYVWNGMDSQVPLTDKNQYRIQVLP